MVPGILCCISFSLKSGILRVVPECSITVQSLLRFLQISCGQLFFSGVLGAKERVVPDVIREMTLNVVNMSPDPV